MLDLFNKIPQKNKVKLLQSLEASTLHFKKNMTILSSLKKDNFIGVVDKGYLHIIKNDYNGDKIIIEELEENDVFGSFMTNLSNTEYEVITKEETDIFIIDFKNITNNNFNNPSYSQFLKNLVDVMSHTIIMNNERIELLTNKTIRNKLLAYFKIMSQKNKSNIIYLPFNYTDLADYLAINRSAMSRELKNMKEEGIIDIKGKKIKLLYYLNS